MKRLNDAGLTDELVAALKEAGVTALEVFILRAPGTPEAAGLLTMGAVDGNVVRPTLVRLVRILWGTGWPHG